MDLVKMFENVRKITILRENIFFKFIFSKSKFNEFSKFQNLTFLKLGESCDSAIFYEQTIRKILVLQANVPDVRQATQNPTMLRNLTFKHTHRRLDKYVLFWAATCSSLLRYFRNAKRRVQGNMSQNMTSLSLSQNL